MIVLTLENVILVFVVRWLHVWQSQIVLKDGNVLTENVSLHASVTNTKYVLKDWSAKMSHVQCHMFAKVQVIVNQDTFAWMEFAEGNHTSVMVNINYVLKGKSA